jgi:outer membrane immunogenic protein
MKKLLLIAGACAAFFTNTSAMATDLDRPAPVYRPIAAPVLVPLGYRWTGCYIGGNGGGIWAHRDWSDPFGRLGDFGSQTTSGALGGFQGGCDYQRGNWLLGVAGDWDWSSATNSNINPVFPAFTQDSKIKSLASLTFRTGYAWDRTLLYVKGGGAWLQSDFNVQAGGVAFATASDTRRGWTVGVGGEYAFLDWLSGFIEYDYYQFRDSTANFPVLSANIDTNVNVVKAGLNLRFGPGVRGLGY